MKRALAFAAAAALAGVLVWKLWPRPAPQSPVPQAPTADAEVQARGAERREVAPSAPAANVRRAAAQAPPSSPWAELNNEAVAALERGELERAVELFEQCLAGASGERVFARNLAEALARLAVRDHELERPCARCVELLERAVQLAPERSDLAQLLERWRKELATESEFHRVQSTHFELAYEVWREGLVDQSADLLAALELHYVELAQIFDVRPGERARIPVSLYRPAEFANITGLAEWAGASYDGVIRAPVAEERALGATFDELLRHELIHAFVREAGGRDVPGWLNEGLAQWLQRAPAGDLRRARGALRGQPWIELASLRGSLTSLPDTATVTRAYAQSLAFCAYLDEQHGRGVLLAMVAGCKRGEAVDATFQSWTRLRLSEAEALFRAGL